VNLDQEIVFTERQKFSQWWIWALLPGINMIFFFGLTKQLIFGEQFGNNPLSNTGLGLLSIGFLAFTFLFYKMGLYTKIDKHGIYFKFTPFHVAFRFYPWEKITGIQVTKYKAFKEYGGWGIRGGRNGMAYTISGDTGIEIELQKNKKILIGTRKPEEVKKLVKKLSPSCFPGD
jgi:hypothetical protein